MKAMDIINMHRRFYTLELYKHLKIVTEGAGNCVMEMEVQEAHQNSLGTLHGGLSGVLIDEVSQIAIATMTEGKLGATVDLNVKYLNPAKRGETILIDARILKIGKRIAFTNCDILEKTSRKLVAQGGITSLLNYEKDVNSKL